MKTSDADLRLVFAPYILHPLLRGLFEWLRIQVLACLDCPERGWGGLVEEVERLLSGTHQDPSPERVICSMDPDNWKIYRYRIVDTVIYDADFYVASRTEGAGRDELLDWYLKYLDCLLSRQRLLLKQSSLDVTKSLDPDWKVLGDMDELHYQLLRGAYRSIESMEFGQPFSQYTLEGLKFGAVVSPLFETYSPLRDLTLAILYWMRAYYETRITENTRCVRLRTTVDALISGKQYGPVPELNTISRLLDSLDSTTLKKLNTQEFVELDTNIEKFVSSRVQLNRKNPLPKYLDCNLQSRTSIALRYINADICYLEALGIRTLTAEANVEDGLNMDVVDPIPIRSKDKQLIP